MSVYSGLPTVNNCVHIWWVLWENRPVQGLKQSRTYSSMVGMLSGITNRGGYIVKDAQISDYFDTKYDCTSYRTNFTQFWRLKICRFFKPWTGQFSPDTRRILCETHPVNSISPPQNNNSTFNTKLTLNPPSVVMVNIMVMVQVLHRVIWLVDRLLDSILWCDWSILVVD